MSDNKKRLSAVDGVERRIKENIKSDQTYIGHSSKVLRDRIYRIYEKAVWIDSQLNGSCIVDPFLSFHFYDEEDAVAFKLRWEE